jgi:hypothetical protein
MTLQCAIDLRKEVRRLLEIIEAQDPGCVGKCDRETWRRMVEMNKQADAAYRALSPDHKMLYGVWAWATTSEADNIAMFGVKRAAELSAVYAPSRDVARRGG